MFCTNFESKNTSELAVMLRRRDGKSCLAWWLCPVPIARWADCPCPCVSRREQSPYPSGGLSSDLQGCRASAPRLHSWGASAPAGPSMGVHWGHLTGKKIKNKQDPMNSFSLHLTCILCNKNVYQSTAFKFRLCFRASTTQNKYFELLSVP